MYLLSFPQGTLGHREMVRLLCRAVTRCFGLDLLVHILRTNIQEKSKGTMA